MRLAAAKHFLEAPDAESQVAMDRLGLVEKRA